MRDAGVKPSVALATVSTMRSLERNGVVWDEVTEADLLNRCGNHRDRLHRLRRGLGFLVGKEEALRRWPGVYRRTNERVVPDAAHIKTPILEAVLPAYLRRCAADDPVRQLFAILFRKWMKHGGPGLSATFRSYFAFLYGFLVGDPASMIPDAHRLTLKEIQAKLRAVTHKELVLAYDRYRQESPKTQGHITLNALSTQLHVITVVFKDLLHIIKQPVMCCDFGIITPKKRKRTDVASTVGASTVSSALSAFHEEPLLVDRSASWIHDPQATKRGQAHCFNATETRALYLACETLMEKLLVTALFTTGMRIGGFCLCRSQGALTGLRLTTNEKGNRIRDYPVSPGMAALLPQWASVGGPGQTYLFPEKNGGLRPMDTRRARYLFMTVAKRAGVQGPYVKPHTTRHTVCWTLSALGNKLDEVADFAGHRSVAVTQSVYIAMNEAQKRSRMNIPWMEADEVSEADRLMAAALELAESIAGPFASSDGRTFPRYSKRASRPAVQFTVPVAIDETHHAAVCAASVTRAEQKAAKKESKRSQRAAMEENLRRQCELVASIANRPIPGTVRCG